MVTIVTRAGKGSELTHNEVDANFTNLNEAVELGRYTATTGSDGTSFELAPIVHNFETKNVIVGFVPNNPVSGTNYLPFVKTEAGWEAAAETGTLQLFVAFELDSQTFDETVLLGAIQDTADPEFIAYLPSDSITATVINSEVAAYTNTTNEVDLARQGYETLDERLSAFARKYVTTIGNGTDTTFTIEHNLGTQDVILHFRPNNPISGEDYTYPWQQPGVIVGGVVYSQWEAQNIDSSSLIQIAEQSSLRTYNECFILVDFNASPIPADAITVTVIG